MAANVWFAEAAQGHWWIVKAPWNEIFYGQLDLFPEKQAHDDHVTSVTGARLSIAPVKRFNALHFAHLGQKFEKPKEMGVGSMRKSTS